MRALLAFVALCLSLVGALAQDIGFSPPIQAQIYPPTSYSYNFAGFSTFPSWISSFTGNNVRTYFDSSGNLQTVGTNVPRFGFDFFSQMALGYTSESAATNVIRNNTMVGAVAGTPGTLPTNWSVTTNSNGLSTSIATGTVRNMNFIDFRTFGTTTGIGAIQLYFEATNQIASGNNVFWTSSAYLELTGGSSANISNISLDLDMRDVGNVFLAFVSGLNINTNVIPTNLLRMTNVEKTNNASVAFVSPVLTITPSGSGVAVDITIRVVLPQMETGQNLSSPIQTTNAAIARTADIAQIGSPVAAVLASRNVTVTALIDGIAASQATILGLTGAAQPGFGFFNLAGPELIGSYDNIHFPPLTATVSTTQGILGGLSIGANRVITADGGTTYGGTVSTDAYPISLGPYFAINQSGQVALGNIAQINIWNTPLSPAQLTILTNPAQFGVTAAWGDSYTGGTGSVSPGINWGYVGYLVEKLGSTGRVFPFAFPGQTSTFIATQMVADTKHVCDNLIFETGRNNIAFPATIVADTTTMVAHAQTCLGGNTHWVVLAVQNQYFENSAAVGVNLTAYNNILADNAALAAAFPSNYLDVRSICNAASGGVNDALAQSWNYQGSVHGNDAMYQCYAAQISSWGHSHGWFGY